MFGTPYNVRLVAGGLGAGARAGPFAHVVFGFPPACAGIRPGRRWLFWALSQGLAGQEFGAREQVLPLLLMLASCCAIGYLV